MMLSERGDRYQLLFTSSKNIDPSQSYGWLKVSAYGQIRREWPDKIFDLGPKSKNADNCVFSQFSVTVVKYTIVSICPKNITAKYECDY
jgi:hypothetical protein